MSRRWEFLIDWLKQQKRDCEEALERAETGEFKLCQGDIDITERHFKDPLRRQIAEFERMIEELEHDDE